MLLETNLLSFYSQNLLKLFSLIRLSCSNTAVQPKPEDILVFDFDTHRAAFERLLDNFLKDFEDVHIKPMLKEIRASINSWKDSARENVFKWKRVHGHTVRCFLIKHGNHRTKASPVPSWIKLLLRHPQITLDAVFKRVVNGITPSMKTLGERMEVAVAKLMKALRKDANKNIGYDFFENNLRDKEPQLQGMFTQVGREMKQYLKTLKGRVSEEDNGDYFGLAMRRP